MFTYACSRCDVICISASLDRETLQTRHRCVPPEPPEFSPSRLPPRLEALADGDED